MAVRLDSFPVRKPGPQVTYPWDMWLNGSVWQATQGDDFTCSVQGFASSVYMNARRLGKRVRVTYDDSTVTFQMTG